MTRSVFERSRSRGALVVLGGMIGGSVLLAGPTSADAATTPHSAGRAASAPVSVAHLVAVTQSHTATPAQDRQRAAAARKQAMQAQKQAAEARERARTRAEARKNAAQARQKAAAARAKAAQDRQRAEARERAAEARGHRPDSAAAKARREAAERAARVEKARRAAAAKARAKLVQKARAAAARAKLVEKARQKAAEQAAAKAAAAKAAAEKAAAKAAADKAAADKAAAANQPDQLSSDPQADQIVTTATPETVTNPASAAQPALTVRSLTLLPTTDTNLPVLTAAVPPQTFFAPTGVATAQPARHVAAAPTAPKTLLRLSEATSLVSKPLDITVGSLSMGSTALVTALSVLLGGLGLIVVGTRRRATR